MIDRYGKRAQVGYAAHEILWIKAALKLPRDERIAAFQDIATMTGRTEFAIRDQAKVIRAKIRRDLDRIMAAEPRRPLVPQIKPFRAPKALKSELRQPTLKQLMGCR